MAALLEARSVRKVYATRGFLGGRSETVAVDGFSLLVDDESPSFTTIAGESGSGKTTIAQLLLGLTEPTDGGVLYRGLDVHHMKRERHRAYRKDVQAIFQDPFEVYNPFYKVDHLLTTPVRKFRLAESRAQARDMITRALEAVGLRPDETLGRYPHQLSGGQRQRITIARALLLEPKLIIADEPVSMVDASLRATILESLHRLYREFGISFVYITHDLTTAYQVTDDIVILYRGVVAEVGDAEHVIRDPQHPYTRELIESIPAPTPGREWLDREVGEAAAEEDSEEGAPSTGCRYAGRCARAMPECTEREPPLYRVSDEREVACYLFRNAEGEEVPG